MRFDDDLPSNPGKHYRCSLFERSAKQPLSLSLSLSRSLSPTRVPRSPNSSASTSNGQISRLATARSCSESSSLSTLHPC